jgi:hypothetical protein
MVGQLLIWGASWNFTGLHQYIRRKSSNFLANPQSAISFSSRVALKLSSVLIMVRICIVLQPDLVCLLHGGGSGLRRCYHERPRKLVEAALRWPVVEAASHRGRGAHSSWRCRSTNFLFQQLLDGVFNSYCSYLKFVYNQ